MNIFSGENDAAIKPQLARAVTRFTAVDYLQFDPAKEPPPSDIPADCSHDSVRNPRGATVCRKCGRALTMRSKYDVWMDALIATYTGDRYGIHLGATYRDVLQWMPAMWPYLKRSQTSQRVFLDTLYSDPHARGLHANDYGRYLLPRDLLPTEFAYLKENLGEAIALHDPETMGEFLDRREELRLEWVGRSEPHGKTYLLDTQRADGTWSGPGDKDVYTLYHSAVDAILRLEGLPLAGRRAQFPASAPAPR